MNRFKLCTKASALLLAAMMLLSMIPFAHAEESSSKCEVCGTACTQIVLKQANCHEQGVIEYICVNNKCLAYKESVLKKTDIDPKNHDTICFDNKDGLTHTAHCRYHADYKNVKEDHVFVNSYCTKCAAADYSKAEIVMRSSLSIYVDQNDTTAELSAGEIAVMVGSVDITENYYLTYSWVDTNGTIVSTNETYRLPTSVVSKCGDYNYGCLVMAMPKTGATGQYITASCSIKVCVRDMISASAVVGSKETEFTLNTTNNATSASIMQQIYQAVSQSTQGQPSFVIFDTKPLSDVGELMVTAGVSYYFTGSSSQLKLQDVRFIPTGSEAGVYTITFTAFDSKGESFPGILNITIEQEMDTSDVAYYTFQDELVPFSAEKFVSFWQEQYPGGTVKSVFFTQLPAVTEGILFYNYRAGATVNTPVKTTDLFYTVLSNANQYLIDGVAFVPASQYTGHVNIPFEVFGVRADGFYAQESGTLSIFISSGKISALTYSMKAGDTMDLSEDDFLTLYRSSTGEKTGTLSIQLLDAPKYGKLYIDYTTPLRSIELDETNIADYMFFYSSKLGREISELTYVASKQEKDATDSLRYAVYNDKGEFVYIGELVITVKKTATVYTKSFPDVKTTDWFYTYVMDLAEDGVINGFEEIVDGVTVTSYKPQDNVTYAQALKLIMLAVGYAEQAPTGKHWASGYLTKAHTDALVSTVLTEARLNEQISRNMIAQIAARAMNLPKSSRTESPLKDVDMNGIYTSYILSLYDAGIITGDDNEMYNGTNKITRAEMATIVWRINNYED